MNEPKKPVRRSYPMKIGSYYLARCGERVNGKSTRPPRALNVNTWKGACDLFYGAFGDGRSLSQFRNSIKNARDSFDILFDNGRIGWIGKDVQDSPLSASFLAIHEEWKLRSNEHLETFLFGLISKTYSPDVKLEFAHQVRTEGGEKIFVSTRPERDHKLRTMALAGC